MKVRVGYGLGTQSVVDDPARFAALVDGLERNGFDSLWLSERVTGPAPDPLIALAVAAGRTRRLKLGTSVLVVPGRNPVLLAKELASLDRLSDGRLLLAVGLGQPDPREQQAFGVRREDRAPWLDEAVPLLRRLWAEDAVDHHGPRFSYTGLSVRPRPVQAPIDVWLGGRASSELRRTGRLGDGWLASLCTPAEAAAGRVAVERAATEAGRAIDPEHFGAVIVYARSALPDRLAALLAARRPDADPGEIVPVGLPAVRALVDRFVASGLSKFVLIPADEPADWDVELAELADGVVRKVTT